MDGGLDLSFREWPHPGDGSRCASTQAIPLSRALARSARRKQIRTACSIRQSPAKHSPASGPRPKIAGSASAKSPCDDRAAAGANIHPYRKRRIRALEQVIRFDYDEESSCEGKRRPGAVSVPGQERPATRSRCDGPEGCKSHSEMPGLV